jgi:hypothetical protein
MSALRKWLLSGLLVLVPLIITLGVLDWVVSTLDKTLNILPVAWHPDRWIGLRIPGLGVLFALAVLLSIGALASNIVGNRTGELVACVAAPHPGGSVHLFGRQADFRHAFFRKRQRLSQGAAGAVAA